MPPFVIGLALKGTPRKGLLKGGCMNNRSKFWQDLKSGRFASMVKESARGQTVTNALHVYNILKPLFAEQDDIEQAYFIFLDTRNRIISIEKLFSGSITSASIFPRELVKRLISLKASAFIMGHNHPSGETHPSAEDKSITMKIGIAAAAIDTFFHDHLIFGEGYHSMADSGWLGKVSAQFSKMLEPE
jgi:DNA repair protein RadC